ncbi:MAG: hypothetical protein GY756_22155 [bacterium]|nr:hypothetical protein [bacterium]
MNNKPNIRSVTPFIVMLAVTITAIIYTVLVYDIKPYMDYQILRSIMTLGLIFMFFYSIKIKVYIHTIFFSYLILAANPFLDVGYFFFTERPKDILFEWEVVKYISIIFFIYFCTYYYPYKRKY